MPLSLHCVLGKPSISGIFYFMGNNKKWDNSDMFNFASWVKNENVNLLIPKEEILIEFEKQVIIKECKVCMIKKPKSFFSKLPSGKFGVQSICRECRSIQRGFVIGAKVKSFPNERWIDIRNWEGVYQVSDLGRIKRLFRTQIDTTGREQRFNEKLLKPTISSGYAHVGLSKDTCIEKATVHRLVAEHFIPNPKNKPEVNHKNKIRNDNKVSNLEWATISEQRIHSIGLGTKTELDLSKVPYLNIFNRRVNKVCIESGEIKTYTNILDAARDGEKLNPYCILACCKNENKTHSNCKWEYA